MTTTPDPRQAVGLDTPPAQPPTWPPYAPHQARGRWSLPVAIVIAAIVVSASAIAIALITHSSAPAPAPAAPAHTAAATNADSPTCTGWRGAKAVLDQTEALPDGWDWTTPGVDQLIASRNAVIVRTMDIFEPQIADQPADLAKVAHAYVAARRNEAKLLAAHTYTAADGVVGTSGYHQLNQMCGIGN